MVARDDRRGESHRRARADRYGYAAADETGFQHVIDATRTYFRAFVNLAKDQAANSADRYKNEAAQVVDDLADSLRLTGERHGTQSGGRILVDDIADGLSELSNNIRDLKLSPALKDLERLAQERPKTLVLASIAVGLILSRAAVASRVSDAESGEETISSSSSAERSRRNR